MLDDASAESKREEHAERETRKNGNATTRKGTDTALWSSKLERAITVQVWIERKPPASVATTTWGDS